MYQAQTFVAGETPTTAKWNYLWSNDAYFNTYLTDVAGNVILSGGVTPVPGGTSLSATRSALEAYIAGVRLSIAATPTTYAASKDSYVDLGPDGVYDVNPVNNGAASPALAADHQRIEIVTTNGTTITGVRNSGVDSLGNTVGPKLSKDTPVTTITNTGTGGGTINYQKIGKLVKVFGRSASLSPGGGAGSSIAAGFAWPTGLFSSAPQVLGFPGELTVQGDQQVYENNAPTTTLTTLTLRQATAGAGATGKIIFTGFGIGL